MASKQKGHKQQGDAFWDSKQEKIVKDWLKSSEGRDTLSRIMLEDSKSSKIIKKMNTVDRNILIKSYTI